MAKIVHSEIEGKSLNTTYWQVDVEALALEVEQLKALVKSAYREGWTDGNDEGRKADAHRTRLPNLWQHSRAKAALAAKKGGG